VALTGIIAVSALAGRAGAGSGADLRQARAVRDRVFVVRPGDTVWRIAARVAGPQGDPRPVVDRLVAANHIRDGVIVPGERLSLPSA
jgi:hypothetical protein